jgi:hypothetical protein
VAEPVHSSTTPESVAPDAPVVDLTKLPDIPPPSPRTVVVEALSLGQQKKVGRAGKFEIYCDEPPRLGGDDEYPQPLTYLVAGVAF